MAFFKSKPNVPDGEKARIEFHAQQIAENLGFPRLELPILSPSAVFGNTPADTMKRVGQHLSHDVSDIQIVVEPKAVEKCGGGG